MDADAGALAGSGSTLQCIRIHVTAIENVLLLFTAPAGDGDMEMQG